MDMNLIEVTPDMARAWLRTCTRKLNERLVEQYAERMRNGAWEITHHPIVLSDAGILLDGQHRLEAIVRTGKSFLSYIKGLCSPKQKRPQRW